MYVHCTIKLEAIAERARFFLLLDWVFHNYFMKIIAFLLLRRSQRGLTDL